MRLEIFEGCDWHVEILRRNWQLFFDCENDDPDDDDERLVNQGL